MAETENYQTPTADDLTMYALEHNISYPLLVDIGWVEQSRFSVDSTMPSLTLFGRGPVVEIIDGEVTEQDIVDLL